MAALTPSESTKRLQVGDRVFQTFRVTVVNLAATDEWVPTNFSRVDAVVSGAVLGTALANVNFVKNAQGTGVAEDVNPGDVAIESDVATDVEVTVIGIP